MSNVVQDNLPLKIQKFFFGFQFCLRFFTTFTTLAATWLMLTNKQSIQIGDFELDARYSYSSAFRFFAFANVVVSALAALSLISLMVMGRYGSNPAHFFFMFIHDLFMLCLIIAGCAAATAIGFVGKYGNTHSGWMPICDHFGKFCHRSTISISLSYVSLALLLILTITSASKSRQIIT